MHKAIKDTLEHIGIYADSINGEIIVMRHIENGIYEALIEYKPKEKKYV